MIEFGALNFGPTDLGSGELLTFFGVPDHRVFH